MGLYSFVTDLITKASGVFSRRRMNRMSDVAVHSQWESFFLFAVLFVLGLGLIAYIVYLAFASKSKAEDPA